MSEVGDEVSPAKIKNICKDEDETFMNGQIVELSL